MPSSPSGGSPAAEQLALMRRIGRSAHEYGLPAYELDDLLTGVAASLGLRATVITTASVVDCSIESPGRDEPYSLLILLGAVSYDLNKLSQVLELVERIRAGAVGADRANERLDEIEALRPPYPAPVVGAAYAACGAGFAVLLSAGWRDVALAAALSVVVFAVVQWAERWQWLAHRLYVVSALVAGTLAAAVGAVLGESNVSVVALCAFVVLIPGLGLTLGAFELTTGHTTMGWHRFIAASVKTFALFAGATIGVMAAGALFGVAETPDVAAYGALELWTFLVALMVGLVIVFQVVPRQAPWAVLAGLVAYAGLQVGTSAAVWPGPFLGALALGLYATVYVRLERSPTPMTVVLPGILILVPGVAAYASLQTLEADSSTAFMSSSGAVLIQIIAILVGLFVAGSLVDLTKPVRRPASRSTARQGSAHG